jgi:uncharacterized protein (TIGR00369 family)
MSDPHHRPPSSSGSSRTPREDAFVVESLAQYVPHNKALGIRFVGLDPVSVTLGLPYDEKLVGNPLTGVLHGGAITALLDATCGAAVFVKVGRPMPVATLDLRIDYLRPATPRREIVARAECFRVTESVAFVRARAYHEGPEDELVAVANGTFTLFRGNAGGPAEKTYAGAAAAASRPDGAGQR